MENDEASQSEIDELRKEVEKLKGDLEVIRRSIDEQLYTLDEVDHDPARYLRSRLAAFVGGVCLNPWRASDAALAMVPEVLKMLQDDFGVRLDGVDGRQGAEG